ncbi:MAG: nitroreductase [Burkholderiales bacterium]
MNRTDTPAMTVEEAIRERRSVRGFLPTEVPLPVLHEIFALSQQSPSNCNVQPWLPHVVSGAALQRLRTDLVAAADAGEKQRSDWPADFKLEGVYRERQFDAAAQLYDAMGVERHDRPGRHAAFVRNQAFFDAPHALFVFLESPFNTREAVDVGMYMQTLMLALTARGLASCAQGALRLYPDIVRRHLGLADRYRLLLGMSFGYEDASVKANAARVSRAALGDAVVFHSA